MKIKVFYHVIDLPKWETITQEQLTKLKTSGLMSVADVYVNLHYRPVSFVHLKEYWRDEPNLHFLDSPDSPAEMEHSTAVLMQQMALNSGEDFYALYMHQKGITYIGTEKELPTRDWRWLMDYWTIERYRDCVQKLSEGYDTTGCNYNPDFTPGAAPHFGGNQHWVTSDFLKRITVLQLPSQVQYKRQVPHLHHYRCDIENWYGANQARAYGFYHSHVNHYHDLFPPELYRA
jgi:hypothetical protein